MSLSALSGERSRQYALTGSQNWSNYHRFIGIDLHEQGLSVQ
ncbi:MULTISPECIES: hypothetical protein [unclassified Microcoleus]